MDNDSGEAADKLTKTQTLKHEKIHTTRDLTHTQNVQTQTDNEANAPGIKCQQG